MSGIYRDDYESEWHVTDSGCGCCSSTYPAQSKVAKGIALTWIRNWLVYCKVNRIGAIKVLREVRDAMKKKGEL